MGIEGYYEDYFDERQDEKLTNFQKIKNMTLDEMAETITLRVIGGMSALLKADKENTKDEIKEFILLNAEDILNCIKQWLQEEREE